jgi:CBS domain-containing protein
LSGIDTLTVADFVEKAITVDPSESVSKLIGNLKSSKAFEAFVNENDRTSIITFRELLDSEEVASTKVSNIMLAVPRLNEGDSVLYAAKMMYENRLRALPVFRDGKFLGKITSLAIVKRLLDNGKTNGAIRKIMTTDPIILQHSDDVAKAKSLMMRRRVDQLPILKNAKLDSVITSDAIVYSYLSEDPERVIRTNIEESRFGNTAASIASVEATSNNVTDAISKVAQNMFARKTNYSVILENDTVMGIITFRDLLKLLPIEEKDTNVPAWIVGLPENPMDAEIVTSKFTASVKTLQTMDPTLQEVRAVIKNKEVNSGTMLHQVQVFIDALEWHESYEVSGYDISKLFAEIDTWIKRIASKRDKKPDRERKRDRTVRKLEPP